MEWISVKDRLPQSVNDCLVTDGICCAVASYSSSDQEWDFFGLTFWDSEEVTHWMPLPETPESLNS